jgi:hypothetical protein
MSPSRRSPLTPPRDVLEQARGQVVGESRGRIAFDYRGV